VTGFGNLRPRRALFADLLAPVGPLAANDRLVDAPSKSTDHRLPTRDISAAQAGERGRNVTLCNPIRNGVSCYAC